MSGLYSQAPTSSNDDDWQNDPLYRTSTIDEEKLAEEQQYKNTLSDLQKQTLDRTTESRYLGTKQQLVSGTHIPTVKPTSDAARKFLKAPPPNAIGNTGENEPVTAAPAHHPDLDTKHLRKTCENTSRFNALFDAIKNPFSRKEKSAE